MCLKAVSYVEMNWQNIMLLPSMSSCYERNGDNTEPLKGLRRIWSSLLGVANGSTVDVS